MTFITPPAPLPLRNAKWRLSVPMQVNRSGWTGTSKKVGLPGAQLWSVSGQFVTMISEVRARPWRAFFMSLRGQANSFPVYASEGQQHATGNPRAGWAGSLINGGNVAISGDDTVATKNAGGTGYNASAYTKGVMRTGDQARFFAAQSNKAMFVGLNASPTGSTGYADMPVAWYLKADGTLEIYETNVSQGSFGSYTGATILGFNRTAGGVQYVKDGVVVRTLTASLGSLHLDSSINDNGAAWALQRGTIAAGATSLPVAGLAPSATSLLAGFLATIRPSSGSTRLVCLTADAPADADGNAILQFEPEIPEPAAEGLFVETQLPFGVMSLTSEPPGWDVDVGQLYSFTLNAEEAR